MEVAEAMAKATLAQDPVLDLSGLSGLGALGLGRRVSGFRFWATSNLGWGLGFRV